MEVYRKKGLSEYTTFRIGGPADLLVIPHSADELRTALALLNADPSIPRLVMGGGANVLISDKGFRGVVIVTTGLNRMSREGDSVRVEAGKPISKAAWELGQGGWSGLHFLYGMPGSTGGAVWMNARCYGSEVANVLESATLMDRDGTSETYLFNAEDFGYKRSPFQRDSRIIVEARFKLSRESAEQICKNMVLYREDREKKGHYDFPSAGSMFKNDRRIGVPSGRLIDQLNLRGYRIGDAAISERHGNIFVNRGSATAHDMRRLVEEVQRRALEERGVRLEPEVQFLGDWD